MAIDNPEKRKSVSGIGLEPWTAPGVTPNSGLDAQWRAQAGWSYSGLIPDPPGGEGDSAPELSCGTLPTAGLGMSHTIMGGGGGMS